jgi:hypothetical protein
MSDPLSSGFGKFVPGFDFLQGLAKQAGSGVAGAIPQLPNLGNWVAPTLNVEELEKRIEELKAVQFWLDQNAMALKATIQALEVQKMTLATLKGMNFNMGDVANAFKIKAADTVLASLQKPVVPAGFAPEGSSTGATKTASKKKTVSKSSQGKAETEPSGVDPTAWWGSLTQQFTQIAANAIKDVSQHASAGASKGMAEGLAKGAVSAATGVAGAVGSAMTDAVKSATGVALNKRAPVKKAAKSAGTSARKR